MYRTLRICLLALTIAGLMFMTTGGPTGFAFAVHAQAGIDSSLQNSDSLQNATPAQPRILTPEPAPTSAPPASPTPQNSTPPNSTLQSPAASDYTFAECSRADSEQIQAEMEAIALQVLGEATGHLDFQALVDRKWVELNTGAVFEQQVDAALAQVREEVPYWDRLWSGWSSDKAGEIAENVATRAFESQQLVQALEELTQAIIAGLVVEIETMTARSASSSLLCLQAYVGDGYSDTLFALFQQEIGAHLTFDGVAFAAGDLETSPLEMRQMTLGGAGVIVASQVAGRIAQTMSQKMASRLAGKVASRVLGRLGATVIPYVGWVVGVGMIVWDLVEGAEGALPQIREALVAEDVAQSMREEIAAELAEQMDAEAVSMAGVLAETLTGAWVNFCNEHALLCGLTASHTSFRILVEATPLAQIEPLAELAQTWYEIEGMDSLENALAGGQFGLLAGTPEATLPILRWSQNPETTVAWAEQAAATRQPQAMARVAETEIYRKLAPDTLPVEQLATFVTIDDNLVINKLISLEPDVLASLLARLSTAHLSAIAENATSEQLAWLAAYLAMRDTDETGETIERLAQMEFSIAALQADATGSGSPNPDAAAGSAQSGLAEHPSSGVQTAEGVNSQREAPYIIWGAILRSNSVLVAALLLLVLSVGAGILVAIRQNLLSRSN